MSLTVDIPDTFNGPMDLLLHLIRRDEMDIHDIPIARLTGAYLEEIRKPGFVDVDEAADFMDMASRLVDIKLRILTPPEESENPEEEDTGIDPRSGLVEALLEYRRFKDAAKLLGDMAEEQARRYPRQAPRLTFTGSIEPGGGDPEALSEAFASLFMQMLETFPENYLDQADTITYTERPLSERIEQIDMVLRTVGGTRFSLLLSGLPDRGEIVGFFIAMLEMIRQGRLFARQSETYADIILERREPPVAKVAAAGPVRRRSPVAVFGAFPPAAPGRLEIPKRESGRGEGPTVFPPPAPERKAAGGSSGRKEAPTFFC